MSLCIWHHTGYLYKVLIQKYLNSTLEFLNHELLIIYIRESYSPQSDLHIIFLNQKSIVFKYNMLTFFKNPFILFLHKKSIWMLYHFIEQMEYLQIFYYETSELDQVAWQDGSYWFLIPNTLKKNTYINSIQSTTKNMINEKNLQLKKLVI